MNDELEEYSLDVSDGRRRAHGRAHDRDAKGTTPRPAAVTGLALSNRRYCYDAISPIEEEKMQPKAAHHRGTERHSKLLISRFHNYHVMLYSCIFLNL